ncbi:NFX1-type zinc finger-containing protein 1-like [Liolophura sinensis]|uniref:NFX1-type zinc finger-containing protein 1-like n=1 Tax=Liolophura sinensis TaxID=3198878 RepID=UPI003158DB12
MYDSDSDIDLDLELLTLEGPTVPRHDGLRRRLGSPREVISTEESNSQFRNVKRISVLEQCQSTAQNLVSNATRGRSKYKTRGYDSALWRSRVRRYASETNIATEGSNSTFGESKYTAEPCVQRQGWRGRRNSGSLKHQNPSATPLTEEVHQRSEVRSGTPRGGRGRGRGRGMGHKNEGGEPRRPRTAIMGYRRLTELSQKDCDERTLCMSLISETSGFSQLLDGDRIKPDLMELLLEILAKASKSTVREYVLHLLTKIAQSRFLEQHVSVGYLLRMPHEVHQHRVAGFIESVKNLLEILEAILSTLPRFSDKCLAVLIILETIPQRLGNIQKDTLDLLDSKIAALNERANDLNSKEVRKKPSSARGEKQQERTAHLAFEEVPPPDDFREVSICPTFEDIHTNAKTYLRRNKESGAYDDHNHYLDVQFRLLREDYVRPLREGIAEYLRNVKVNRPDFKLSDMRLYRGVQIICPMCTSDGIAYRIQFDNTKLRQVRWQASKRLIYGSLLCLSPDNFQTLLFATVINRDLKDLVDGFVDIRFLDHFTFDEHTGDRYVVAETTAYFEAYRHVLQGLQELDNVPFQRYIVSCQTEVLPPMYLRRDIPPAYDLSCCVKEDASSAKKLRTKAVSVLTTSRWPGTDTLCFDDSQLNAVKTALSKEFAVIQGPPGTGKTFVGLKIVRALLENNSAWGSHKPILIVCYTNHALDQFLEGMLDFGVTGLLRVGGRSSSEKLEKSKIRSIKQEMKRNKTRRRDLMDLSRDCHNEMKMLESEIENMSVKLELTARGILHEQSLRNYMTEDQFESFGLGQEYTSWHKKSAMPLWLEISVDIYGQAEGFGQSRLYAVTPGHIESLLFQMRMNQKDTFEIHEILQTSKDELERNLAYALAEDFASIMGTAGWDRWDVYRQLHARFETHQVFQLSATETEIKLIESRVMNSTQSRKFKPKKQDFGDKALQQALEQMKQKTVEIKDSLHVLRSTLGILRASVLMEIMTQEEQRAFGFQPEKFDDLFFARWLGYGDVIDILLKETAAEDGYDDQESGELIDAEEEADMVAGQRILEEGEDEGICLAQSLKQHRELATSIATNELSVNLDDRHHVTDQGGGWQVKSPSRKKLKQRVKQIIQSVDKMSADEAESVYNVWQLNFTDRCRLYMYWLSEHRDSLKSSIRGLSEKYDAVAGRLRRVREDEDYHIMNEAKVIGMTTTGAAKYRNTLQRLKPPIIVVEEAAEVLESHIVTALNSSCEHLILIGDHKQLRPSPAVYELARHYNLELSLFERMVKNGLRCDTLELQHRMRPEIADLMQFIYPGLKNHHSVLEMEDVKGVSCNVFFLDHQFPEVAHEENKSRSNKHEALFLAAFCRYLLLQGYEPSQITVLTTYSGQVFELRKAMPKKSFAGVRVTAVDNYQGEENDIILLSLVRSNKEGKIGFLSIENRVCVALSRARRGIYVIGNFGLLAEQSPLWSKMINFLKSKSRCGAELELYCQNHPGLEKIRAKVDKDFSSAPEGGCMRPCESRLTCGHQCQKPCHVTDTNHQNYVCQKPCAKLCSSGHRCKKLCYKDCGKCSEMTKKTIPICGHEQRVPCHQDPITFTCKAKCEHILPCGHLCAEPCGDAHTKICKVEVPRIWPCGHVVKTACCNNHNNFACPQPCSTTLDCGHPCAGTCSKCLQGRLHEGCKQKCGRTLVCGHECRQSCCKSCSPCIRACENRCVHSRCERKCGEECIKCREPCLWSCKHYKCTKLCGELCNRPPCNKPCKKRLPCGHRCIGLCGEDCPTLCLVCNKKEVCETFFGTEDDPNARFILLEDCKHVFEVSGLDYWMRCDNDDNKKCVQLKGCPKCKVAIRRSLRYGNVIKKALADVELAKSKIRGSADEIFLEKTRLEKNLKRSLASEDVKPEIMRRLDHTSLSLQQLNVLENQILLLENVNQLSAKLKVEYEKGHIGKDDMEYISHSLQIVSKVIMRWFNIVSDQQLREAKFELQRLSYLFKARLYSRRLTDKSSVQCELLSIKLERTILKLKGNQPFNNETEEEMLKLEAILKKLAPLGISESERVMVVKAMDLAQGHWFKCPNGHVYAIGDCGGAMEEATCPECKSKIGGTCHKLLRDNTLASEMDGAKFAAWSDQANMNNYDIDDLL